MDVSEARWDFEWCNQAYKNKLSLLLAGEKFSLKKLGTTAILLLQPLQMLLKSQVLEGFTW